jgi:hypothetical protein
MGVCRSIRGAAESRLRIHDSPLSPFDRLGLVNEGVTRGA